MARKFKMPSTAQKAAYLRLRFGELAPRYDIYNDLLTQGQHRRWKDRLVGRLRLPAHARVLDLCCGSGDLALRCLKVMQPQQSLVAVDFAEPMVQLARRRLRHASRAQDVPRWHVLCADAMQLPFPDQQFDVIMVGYGLRNVDGLPAFMAELYRVLRAGGQLACLDIGKVRNPLLRPLVQLYLRQIAPRLGKMLQPGQDLFDYLPRSTAQFPHQDQLLHMLRQQGFCQTECLEQLGGSSILLFAAKPA